MIIVAGLLTFVLVSQTTEHHGCLLGLTVNVSVNGGVKELTDSILEERKMGCNVMASSVKWSELEPSPGDYKLDKLRNDLSNQAKLGFTPVLTIQTIDTNNRALPLELAAERWDSEVMLAREKSLLDAVAKVLPSETGAVMLGNEVDIYLRSHRDEINGYVRFLANGKKCLKAARSGTSVGVTTTFSGIGLDSKLISRLQNGMDLVSMTYYPERQDFSVLPVSEVSRHFEQMTKLAAGKLFIQEAGYPASQVLGSSEEQQAAFVDALFDAMARYKERLYGVCYFLSVDFNDKLVNSFVRYYDVGTEQFRAMLSTLGLKKQDGTPRAAWAEFKKRASAF